MEETREMILRLVNAKNGIRSVELALDVMGMVNPTKFDTDEFHKTLEKLIISDEIVELVYISPDMDYPYKSIFFKKGTQFANLRGDSANSSKDNLDRQGERDSALSCDEIKGEFKLENTRYGKSSQVFYRQR
jgi:hypothetical protein